MAGDLPEIKTVVIGLSRQGGADGVTYAISEFDLIVSSWIKKGYKLFATHYLGEDPTSYHMMFVFTLNQ